MYKEILIFAGGALLGAACTYLIVNKMTKTKYEAIANSEIAEVKNLYLSKCRKLDDIKKNNEEKEKIATTYVTLHSNKFSSVTENDIAEKIKFKVKDIIRDNSYEVIPPEEDEDEEDRWEREAQYPVDEISSIPYTITPDQFVNEKRYYDKITLLYYENGVLTSEAEDYEEDIDSTIGQDSLNKFGEFEEDAVYVRNDRLSIDYEVLLQHCDFEGDTT